VAVAVLVIIPVLVVPVVQAVVVVVLRPPQEEQLLLRGKVTTEAQVMLPLVLVVAQEQLVEQAQQSRWVPLAVTDSNLLSQVQQRITLAAAAVVLSRALAVRAVTVVEAVVEITTATHLSLVQQTQVAVEAVRVILPHK
jgi:hypothetical protein